MQIGDTVAVSDMGYGDAGKGATVDFLCRELGMGTVVKWHGGPQCAHNVVDGNRQHTFSQFGSGTFAGWKTYLGPDFVVNPLALKAEADHLFSIGISNPYDLITIHPDCRVVTLAHRKVNQRRELLRGNRHGSCGIGFGECVSDSLTGHDVLRIKDLVGSTEMAHPKLTSYISRIEKELGEFSDFGLTPTLPNITPFAIDEIIPAGPVVFEGSQGMMIDERYGTFPHNTWSDCTFNGAEKLAAEWGRDLFKLGVLRSYSTRHGFGPFPTEGTFEYPEPHNSENQWQGGWRTGVFDMVAAKYTTRIARPDALVINHMDAAREPWEVCEAYRHPSDRGMTRTAFFDSAASLQAQEGVTRWLSEVKPVVSVPRQDPISAIELGLHLPVVLTADGPEAKDRTWLK